MTVKRIIPNIASSDPAEARAFYENLLGLKLVMDFGWILTFAEDTVTTPQLSVASQGGAGTPVPDISIEVDKVDAVYKKALAAGYDITYPLQDEEWGVRRFLVRDPAGKLLNILSHVSLHK